MNADELDHMRQAREALAHQRNELAKRISVHDVATITMAEDLTEVLLAIEAVDRALVDAGHPYMAADT